MSADSRKRVFLNQAWGLELEADLRIAAQINFWWIEPCGTQIGLCDWMLISWFPTQKKIRKWGETIMSLLVVRLRGIFLKNTRKYRIKNGSVILSIEWISITGKSKKTTYDSKLRPGSRRRAAISACKPTAVGGSGSCEYAKRISPNNETIWTFLNDLKKSKLGTKICCEFYFQFEDTPDLCHSEIAQWFPK